MFKIVLGIFGTALLYVEHSCGFLELSRLFQDILGIWWEIMCMGDGVYNCAENACNLLGGFSGFLSIS